MPKDRESSPLEQASPPDSPDATLQSVYAEPITLESITWNMGNQEASPKAVAQLMGRLEQRPTVIALSTQEEFAPKGSRLHDKLLAALGDEYELVHVASHKTTAGANNNPSVLLHPDNNRVSLALIVKKPYKLNLDHLDTKTSRKKRMSTSSYEDIEEPTYERIDYLPKKEQETEEQSEERRNKSLITLSGTVISPSGKQVKLKVTGGHWDSNFEHKRRRHENKFLAEEQLTDEKDKSFNKILEQAQYLRIIMGDTNYRDNLMLNGKTQSPRAMQTVGLGFTGDKPTIHLVKGQKKTPLHGTYGHVFDGDRQVLDVFSGEHATGKIDAKKTKRSYATWRKKDVRVHDTKGGDLDRINISTGLHTVSENYGADIPHDDFDTTKKESLYGSDHVFVGRTLKITPAAAMDNKAIVANYIRHRLPSFQDEIAILERLTKAAEGELYDAGKVGSLRVMVEDYIFLNSDLTKDAMIKQLIGDMVQSGSYQSADFSRIQTKIQERLTRLYAIESISKALDEKLRDPDLLKNMSEADMAELFNHITHLNMLRNAQFSVLSREKTELSDEEKSQFELVSNHILLYQYHYALAKANGDPSIVAQYEDLFSDALNQLGDLMRHNPDGYQDFAKALKILAVTQKQQIETTLPSPVVEEKRPRSLTNSFTHHASKAVSKAKDATKAVYQSTKSKDRKPML